MLVDANVIMYAAGTEHPHRRPSLALLEACARGELEAAIDAEVLQEILHRYRAIGRWSAGLAVYDLARRIFPEVVPVTAELLDATRDLLAEHPGLTARDALHAVATRQSGAAALVSYDRGFDVIPGFVRREPPDGGR